MSLLYPEQTNPRTLSPLTLAFVGDGVYELLVRERLACEGSRPAGDLHKRSVAMVRAEAQAAAVDRLLPLLTEEETAYYRPFLFQATTEEQARDLMNIQGMDFIRGFSGTRMATLAMKEALSHLARSREKIAACGDEKFALLDRRLRVMECLIHTLDNACRYQEILDRTRPDETAPLGTQWPAQGDERILKLSEIARAEIDNCYALAALIEGCETELFNLTQEPENEDIFVMTTALPAQLRRKAEIMLDHMRDADAVYETNNK